MSSTGLLLTACWWAQAKFDGITPLLAVLTGHCSSSVALVKLHTTDSSNIKLHMTDGSDVR